MCITRNELEKKIEELRSLKALKEETENELKALEHEVISYMTEKRTHRGDNKQCENHIQATEPNDTGQGEAYRSSRG